MVQVEKNITVDGKSSTFNGLIGKLCFLKDVILVELIFKGLSVDGLVVFVVDFCY
jgi:hypothetical protein